jgi:hypothetical protein
MQLPHTKTKSFQGLAPVKRLRIDQSEQRREIDEKQRINHQEQRQKAVCEDLWRSYEYHKHQYRPGDIDEEEFSKSFQVDPLVKDDFPYQEIEE